MSWKLILWSGLGLVGAVMLGLALTNPSALRYREAVLVHWARQEADRLATEERRLLERELAALQSHLVAVNYEGSKLDAARLRRQYPLLGPAFAPSDDPGYGTLHERLDRSKEKILTRIETTRETMYYSNLVALATQTSRASYGLWSIFETCTERMALSYVGIAGRFDPRPAPTCRPVQH